MSLDFWKKRSPDEAHSLLTMIADLLEVDHIGLIIESLENLVKIHGNPFKHPSKSLIENIERNKAILLKEFQRGFIAGSKDWESKNIIDFLACLDYIRDFVLEAPILTTDILEIKEYLHTIEDEIKKERYKWEKLERDIIKININVDSKNDTKTE